MIKAIKEKNYFLSFLFILFYGIFYGSCGLIQIKMMMLTMMKAIQVRGRPSLSQNSFTAKNFNIRE